MSTQTQQTQTFDPLTLENMKVFKVNDCDWVAAPSKDAAVKWYLASMVSNAIDAGMYGSDDEAIEEPVKECSLDDEMWVEMGNWEAGKTTYRAVLTDYIQRGNTEPYVIASTEY